MPIGIGLVYSPEEQAAFRADLKRAHTLLWDFRVQVQDKWPTPTKDDCLWFAITEYGEAVDAMMRANKGYGRNREKVRDYNDELADVAMMMLSAVHPVYRDELVNPNHGMELYTLHNIGQRVFLAKARHSAMDVAKYTYKVCSMVYQALGGKLSVRVEWRLRLIAERLQVGAPAIEGEVANA
jgi:hypothetical protein